MHLLASHQGHSRGLNTTRGSLKGYYRLALFNLEAL